MNETGGIGNFPVQYEAVSADSFLATMKSVTRTIKKLKQDILTLC